MQEVKTFENSVGIVRIMNLGDDPLPRFMVTAERVNGRNRILYDGQDSVMAWRRFRRESKHLKNREQ